MNDKSTKAEDESHEAPTGGETATDTITHEMASTEQSEAPMPEQTATDELVKAEQHEQIATSEKRSNVGEIAAASGAVASAGGITAGVAGACAGGCALVATGGLVGGGAAVAPIAWAGAPAYLGAKAINHYAFNEQEAAESEEKEAREAARKATNIGALVGVGTTATITVSNGIRTAAVFAKLSSVGGLIGAGPVAGGVMLALIPIATAGIAGAGVYYATKKFKKTNIETAVLA